MKKIFTLSAIAMTALALSVSSCKKSDSNNDDLTSRHDKLVGKWWLVQTGDDNNNNDALDDSEKQNVTGSDTSTTIFNSNGTGTVTGNLSGTPLTLNIQWNLQNNDNDLRLIFDLFGPDTTIVNIKSLTSTGLTIKDPSTTPAGFSVFTKQ